MNQPLRVLIIQSIVAGIMAVAAGISAAAGAVADRISDKIDASARYIFFMHGLAIEQVAGQVRQLLAVGVPAANITVAGHSKGGMITMMAMSALANLDIAPSNLQGAAKREAAFRAISSSPGTTRCSTRHFAF